MRSHIYIRPLRTHDEADVAAFIAAVEGSGKTFPKEAFSLPSTRVMVAEKMEEHGPEIVMYQPHYVSLVMGSFVALGSDVETASALHQMTAAAFTRAHSEGFSEVLMFSKAEETESFAVRHGFEAMHPSFRMPLR